MESGGEKKEIDPSYQQQAKIYKEMNVIYEIFIVQLGPWVDQIVGASAYWAAAVGAADYFFVGGGKKEIR